MDNIKRTYYLSLRDNNKRAALRAEAVRLVREKEATITAVANHFGVSRETIYNWMEAAEEAGDGTVPERHRGKPSRLDPQQCDQLVQLIQAGPRAAGYDFDFWTLERICVLIRDRFGVEYKSYGSLSVKLRGLGLTPQMPERQASERKPAKVKEFREEVLPEVEKKSGGRMGGDGPRRDEH